MDEKQIIRSYPLICFYLLLEPGLRRVCHPLPGAGSQTPRERMLYEEVMSGEQAIRGHPIPPFC